MSDKMVFRPAPYDTTVKVVTWALGPATVGLVLGIGLLSAGGSGLIREALLPVLIVGGALGAVYFPFYAFSSVRRYAVEQEGVVIKKPLGVISLPHDRIAAVDVVRKVKVSLKVLANGGLFGYFGLFVVAGEKGAAHIYGTNLTGPMVRLQTTDGKAIYLTPADPEGFVEAARRARSGERG